MPKFKVRVVNTETIKSVGFVEVSARNAEAARAKVDTLIENCEVYDDGNWEIFNTQNEVERVD
jgi:hypothetical protein